MASKRTGPLHAAPGGGLSPPVKPRAARSVAPATGARNSKGAKGVRLDGERTRRAILDAAEYLFSIDGLTGVSIRRITKQSGTDLASVNYHFTTKEGLFREVLVRRVEAMSMERMHSLQGFAPTGDRHADIEHLLDHFVTPLFGRDEIECASLANYRRLVSLVTNSKTWQNAIFREHYDPTAGAYLARLGELLPELPAGTICWAFNFFLGALTNAMAETGRVDRLSGGECRSSDLLAMKRELLRFATNGLAGMASSGEHR